MKRCFLFVMFCFMMGSFVHAQCVLADFEGTTPAVTFANPTLDLTGPAATITRDGTDFDNIQFAISDIANASVLENGTETFTLDLIGPVPVNTEVVLQLESAAAAPDNFPTGRHSRYVATTDGVGGAQTLTFVPNFDVGLDAAVGDGEITTLVILFAPGTGDGSTYIFDNLQASGPGCPIGGAAPPPPVVPVAPTVPTMSEWGLMIFGLLVLNMGVVFVRRQEEEMAV